MNKKEKRLSRKVVFLLMFLLALFISSDFSSFVFGQTSGVALGQWRETAAFVDANHVSHPLPSFARGNYYYVHTMDASGGDRKLYYAQKQSDGSLGAWQIASSDHGGGPHGFTAIVVDGVPYHFRNGHIARYEFNSDGTMNGDVRLQELSVDSSFGGHKYVWDSAVYAPLANSKWVVHLGGFDFAPYAYRNNVFKSTVPIGNSFSDTGKTHPAERPGKSAFFKHESGTYGYIYTNVSGGDTIWVTRINADGSLENWQSTSYDMPPGTGNKRGDMFVIGDALFVIRGSKVYKNQINAQNGALTVWDDAPPDLPEDQIDMSWGGGHLEGASYGIIGNFVYVTGAKKVYYAQIDGTGAGHPCINQARAGDYDCNGAVDAADFDAWKKDFLVARSTISFFEYWRRVALRQ